MLGTQGTYDISPDGKYFATASQDSTVRIWLDLSCLATLEGHSTKYECLRVKWATPLWQSVLNDRINKNSTDEGQEESPDTTLIPYWLAWGGADGIVHIWFSSGRRGTIDEPNNSHPTDWSIRATLNISDTMGKQPEDDRPQVYAVQWIDNWSAGLTSTRDNMVLLTAADDHVQLWALQQDDSPSTSASSQKNIILEEFFSIRFGDSYGPNGGVTVGRVTSDLPSRADGSCFPCSWCCSC